MLEERTLEHCRHIATQEPIPGHSIGLIAVTRSHMACVAMSCSTVNYDWTLPAGPFDMCTFTSSCIHCRQAWIHAAAAWCQATSSCTEPDTVTPQLALRGRVNIPNIPCPQAPQRNVARIPQYLSSRLRDILQNEHISISNDRMINACLQPQRDTHTLLCQHTPPLFPCQHSPAPYCPLTLQYTDHHLYNTHWLGAAWFCPYNHRTNDGQR